jgi:hypothetical protein
LIHPDNHTSPDGFDSKSILYGARILGSLIGSSQYIHMWSTNKLNSLRVQLIQVASFSQLRCQYQLISQCLTIKLYYIIRTVPPNTNFMIPLFDNMLKDIYLNILVSR